jgi:hypothetical protein
MPNELVQLLDSKLGQAHDRGPTTIRRRQHVASLLLAVHVHDNPGFVDAIVAAKVRVGQKV